MLFPVITEIEPALMKSIISRDTKLVLVAEAVKTLIFDGEFGFDMISSHNLFGLENKNYQT